MRRPRDQDTGDRADADEDVRPRKQRKQRPCYSCPECRRLKMKCDRQVPCGHCVRRQRVDHCWKPGEGPPTDPSSKRSPSPSTRSQVEVSEPSRASRSTLDYGGDHHGRRFEPDLSTTAIDHDDNQPAKRTEIHRQGHEQQTYRQHDQPALLSRPMVRSTGRSDRAAIGADSHDFNPPNVSAHALELFHTQRFPRTPLAAEYTRAPASAGQDATGSHTSFSAPQDDDQSGSYGTLMLSQRGRSKYLGPTAGSEWLKESEMQDAPETPLITRAPTPEVTHDTISSKPDMTSPCGFPFSTEPARVSTWELLSCLPPRDEALTLVESYYRYCSWHHDVAPRSPFMKTFNRIYDRADRLSTSSPVNGQEIALVFIILAQGTVFNIEMPNGDESAEELLHLSERALVKGGFIANNMVAGLQTLHLMAHLHLHIDKGRPSDNAWPLWGLVMRLIQAMGMHRDGARWNLPEEVLEERRKVFWECNAADIFQAHCFSRPSAINPDHCDTAFPTERLTHDGEKAYSIIRFELSQISAEILNMSMKVQKPSYSDVTELDLKLAEFEMKMPFSLRCRAALCAMPSRYPQLQAAIEASPEPSRRLLEISLQQTGLAINISETVINLHRVYYAKALYNVNRAESTYQPSYHTVIERCAMIISVVNDIHHRFPAVSTRQWNFWYHVFNSALCLGTLVLQDPTNPMANFVLGQIETAINLFTSLLQHGSHTPRYKSNLEWLLKLRARAMKKVAQMSAPQNSTSPDLSGHDGNENQREGRRSDEDTNLAGNKTREQDEDVEILGWRTRLIERVGQGRQRTIKTIFLADTPTGSQGTDFVSQAPDGWDTWDAPFTSSSLPTFDSYDNMLHCFWDPMLLQDIFESGQDQPVQADPPLNNADEGGRELVR